MRSRPVDSLHNTTALGLRYRDIETWEKADSFLGPNVPASAISYRLNVIRKEGAAAGFSSSSPTKANGVTATPKRAAPTTKKNVMKGNGRQGRRMLANDLR